MVDKVTSLAVGYVCLNATGTAWLWVWLSTKQPFCFACFFSLLCGKWSCQYVAAIVDIGGFCDCLPEAEPEANNQILIFRHACCRLFSMTRLCCLTGRLRGEQRGEQNSKRKLADDRNPRRITTIKPTERSFNGIMVTTTTTTTITAALLPVAARWWRC
ncbi:hypothetical protein Tsp_09567 [Trichinella spiralis]|uniref:hypothetical protein n=1 Tax=Trichinella spiralis TaxID=6334 RepID=UPI0001EFDB89|nr:hypothetical protein Tsp_09567 [Trichinella spiralis]